MEIRVDVANAEAISRAFLQAPAIVMEELERTMVDQLGNLHHETADGTPKSAGTLRSAWFTDVAVDGSTVRGRLTNPMLYAVPVELGTKPHFPPIEPLIGWVERATGRSGADAESLARGIQRKIGARGSVGKFMATSALEELRPTILDEFAECAKRIQARIAAQDGAAGAPA